MSQFAHKRKRSPLRVVCQKKVILTAFDEALNNDVDSKKIFTSARDRNEIASAELRRSNLSKLCDRLTCLSMDDGLSRLSSLKSEMQRRIWGKSDLACLLFSEEEVDMGPTLCVVVNLLREQCVYFADINAAYIPERALFEYGNSHVCACQGAHAGVKAIIHYLLDESRDSRCNSVLKEFVSIFFRDSNISFTPSSEASRFRLAAFVMDILRNEWTKHGFGINTVVQWVRQAVVPSYFLDDPVQEDDNIIWTAELSGLATCRKVDEYLSCGKCEEEALIALFRTIPAEKASAVYLECVNDAIKSLVSDADWRKPVTGTWSRVILLGDRISDKEVFQDVGEDLRRRVVSFIHGALCSPSCCSNSRSVAVLLCLARRLVIHGRDGDLEHRDALERYTAWFRDLISVSDDRLVQAVLEPMSQLIPLETLSILKLNHRIFSANTRHFRSASDYLSNVRSRIRDSDVLLSQSQSNGLSGSVQKLGKSSLTRMAEIVQFVTHYSQSNGKLPKSLLRQMTFNRVNFQRFIMPLLLDPNFVIIKPSEGELDLGMSAELFDEHRIKLIEEIGFKRKDHAITVTEARKAIAAIKNAKQGRENNENKNIAERKQDLASAQIEEESSLCDIILAVLKDEADYGFNATQLCKDGSKVQSVKDFLCTKLDTLILESKGRNDRIHLATDVLQSLLNALENLELENLELLDFSNVPDGENLLRPYNEFWVRAGRSLLSLVYNMFGRSQLSRIQSEIRTQLFVLLCFRIDSFTNRSLLVLAMLIACLIILQEKSVLCDLCFVHQEESRSKKMRHITSVIFECLPLSTPQNVRASVMFAIYTTCLLMACTGSEIIGIDPQLGDIDFTKSEGLDHESRVVACIKPLQRLVRWVISSPWRMSVSKGGNGDYSMNHTFLRPGNVFRNAVRLYRELTVSNSVDELLTSFLSVEKRCGWGLWSKITIFLRDLESQGMKAISIVHKTVQFLAQTQKENEGGVEWIQRGLFVYHDESNYNENEMKKEDSVVFNIDSYIKLHGGSLSFQMAEYYRLMEFDYFRGCDNLDSHVQNVLVHMFWPIPKRFISYITQCLSKADLKLSVNLNVFFIGNCAALLQEYPSTVRNGPSNRDLSKPQLQIQELITTLQMLVRAENASLEVDDISNGMVSVQGINKMIARIGLKQAFELGIAFGLYISRMCSFNPCVVSVSTKVKSAISLVSAKAGIIVCSDVLDSAVIACALLPFGRVDDETGGRSGCAQRTDEALRVLASERLMLCDNNQMEPFWFRMKLSDDTWKTNSNVLQLLRSWRADIASLCLARVLSTVGFMNEACIMVVKRLISQDLILSTLLPNLAWAYSLVAMAGEAWAMSIKRGLVLGVQKLSSVLDGITKGDIIASLPARFETIVVEMLSLLGFNDKM